jgi:hypothetical protein
MAKYIFSKGQVFVDEGAYRPILKKLESVSKFSVLVLTNRNNQVEQPTKEKEDVTTKK